MSRPLEELMPPVAAPTEPVNLQASSSSAGDGSVGPQSVVPAAVLDKLAALEAQRRTERDKRREAAEEAANPQENVQAFLDGFSSRQQAAQQQLDSLQASTTQGSSSATPDAAALQCGLDALAADMAAQEQRLADASYYLPSFDLKSCTTQVQEFKASLEAARVALLPKKKFTFNKKVARVKGTELTSTPATAPEPPAPSPAAAAAAAAGASERDLALVAAGRGLAGLTDQVVVRAMDQPPGADFVVMDCSGCRVYLLGHLGALRLINLRHCTVVAGPVTGASFMDDLQDCTLVLASYQIRIHRALRTDFYLRVRSRPIIEHSSGLRFAPHNLDHQPTKALLESHNLHEESELYSQVDDFGWIKGVHSPNWRVMPQDQRPPAHTVPDATAPLKE